MRFPAKYTKIIGACAISLFLLSAQACDRQPSAPAEPPVADSSAQPVRTGAQQLLAGDLSRFQGQRIGIVANHTSLVEGVHLVDTLLARGLTVAAVFAPEHGFRGTADAGEAVASGTDPRTGLPIISLYGDNKKPKPSQMAPLDLVIFDIQDVGSRHYTYISTMTYVMEAAAARGIPFLVLDRPNPNGWYVDGPVLEPEHQSFIGMHTIPIVHGLTIGEYATLINAEGWLDGGVQVDLEVIRCAGYAHHLRWEETGLPWVAPSPNLGTAYAAYLYPALCWFEPTPVSIGRGTDSAFTVVGAPWYQPGEASARTGDQRDLYGLQARLTHFTPRSLPGKSKYPKYQDEACTGWVFTGTVEGEPLFLAGLTLLAELYQQHTAHGPAEPFFRQGFARWPGYAGLEAQLKAGTSPEEIYASWQPAVDAFRSLRSRYLLYPD